MFFKNQVQPPRRTTISTAQMNLVFRLRMIWRELATWLRTYMVSLYAGVGNTEAISQRLFRLPLEYGSILRIFFGDQITERYITLMTRYIALLQSLLIARINNDIDSINSLTQQIFQNIDERADFLAGINPYWQKSQWLSLLTSFNRLQIEEATSFLTRDYTRNIEIFERILSLTNVIGDYFSEGIINYLASS